MPDDSLFVCCALYLLLFVALVLAFSGVTDHAESVSDAAPYVSPGSTWYAIKDFNRPY